MKNSPPKWMIKWLEKTIDPFLLPGVMGDLLEEYEVRLEQEGERKANRHFISSALGFVRQKRLRGSKNTRSQKPNSITMLKNYIKTSFRNFRRRKAYFVLNILGLSIGLASFVAIQKYVGLERSYDKFHQDASSIVRILQYDRGNQNYSVGNHPNVSLILKNQLPNVEVATRFFNRTNGLIQYEANGKKDRYKDFNLLYADEDFFSIFSFPVIKGNKNNPLAQPNSLVLTQTLANRIFGSENPIGQTLQFKDPNFPFISCVVSAVVEDVPKNSHFRFEALLSLSTPVRDGQSVDKMGWNAYNTYAKTTQPISDDELESVARTHFVDNQNITLSSQPLTEIHLNSNALFEIEQNGDKRLTNYLSLTSFFILLMAYFNYINFATAKSMDRAKEVGIRKVLGSRKKGLTIQFLTETLILNTVSILLAFGILLALAPVIPIKSVGFDIDQLFNFYGLEGLYIGLAFVVGTFISGIYPALVMSSFKPSVILRGKFSKTATGRTLRTLLTSVQSTISVALVIITTVIYSQIHFMINQEKGVNIDNILVIETPDVRGQNHRTQLEVYRNKLQSHPFVQSVSTASTLPGNSLNYSTPARLPNQRIEESILLNTDGIDENFIDHYEADLLAGRTFDRSFGNEWDKVLLNETAIKLLGIADSEAALQSKVLMEGDTFMVIGVMGDYNHYSLKQSVNAQVFRYYGSWVPQFSVRLSSKIADLPQQISILEQDFHEVFGENQFNSKFLDQSFDAQYDEDRQFGNISGFFSIIAIIIAVLGLIGFIAFTITSKGKEIAIRKVLGATSKSIVLDISKVTLRLNLLAGLVAGGVAYYFLKDWLNQYATQLNLSVLHFVLPIGGLMIVIGLIIAIQTSSLLSKNPVSAINSDS